MKPYFGFIPFHKWGDFDLLCISKLLQMSHHPNCSLIEIKCFPIWMHGKDFCFFFKLNMIQWPHEIDRCSCQRRRPSLSFTLRMRTVERKWDLSVHRRTLAGKPATSQGKRAVIWVLFSFWSLQTGSPKSCSCFLTPLCIDWRQLAIAFPPCFPPTQTLPLLFHFPQVLLTCNPGV